MSGLLNIWKARRSRAFHIFYKPDIFLSTVWKLRKPIGATWNNNLMHKLYGGRHIILFGGRHIINLSGGRHIILFGGRYIKLYGGRHIIHLSGGRHIILYGGRHIILYGGRHIINIKCFLKFAILNCLRFRIRTLWGSLTDSIWVKEFIEYRKWFINGPFELDGVKLWYWQRKL